MKLLDALPTSCAASADQPRSAAILFQIAYKPCVALVAVPGNFASLPVQFPSIMSLPPRSRIFVKLLCTTWSNVPNAGF
jgi:hypothetical protein